MKTVGVLCIGCYVENVGLEMVIWCLESSFISYCFTDVAVCYSVSMPVVGYCESQEGCV